MGILVPEDYPLSELANDDERRVVRALCDGLSDGWLIIPNVGLSGTQRDRQADLVLVHEREGVVVVEVKGHRPRVEGGVWTAHGRPMQPQPFTQAQGNAYALRDRLREALPELGELRIEYGVVFPNVVDVIGDLPPDVHAAQVMTGRLLDAPTDAIEDLLAFRWGNSPIGAEGVEAVVHTLRPDVEFTWDPQERARLARRRLEQVCQQHVAVLERLDVNRRVVVTGAAGTGKSALAAAWARRAHDRGERVLLTCFNVPLGGELRDRLQPDERLTVDSFFDVMLSLPGMPHLEVPDGADADFWDVHAFGHIHRHLHAVTARFDTVIVDEAQDFSPTWIAQLEQLLDPGGPRRLLLLADEAQLVFPRGFRVPPRDDGWTHAQLVHNCRNTFEIANLLRKRLGGAPPGTGGPDALGLRWLEANDVTAAVEQVADEHDRIIDAEGGDPPQMLVATFHRSVRDRLREEMGFVSWEEGGPHAIVCETVLRVKGLEFDHVVLVSTPDCRVTDSLLYVGVSRAISQLTVVGPRSLGERLGLLTGPGSEEGAGGRGE